MQAAADNERTVGIFLRKENAGEELILIFWESDLWSLPDNSSVTLVIAGITQILISLHRTMRFTIAFLDGIRRADANTEVR